MKITRFITIAFLISCLIFCETLYVNADDNSNNNREETYIQSEEEAQLIQNKLNRINYWYLASNLRYLVEPIVVTLNVPCNIQETTYYCGPATVQNIVQFHLGYSKTQSQYAALLSTNSVDGTSMANIAGVLNSELGTTMYVYEEIQNYSSWATRIRYGIDNEEPAVLDINTVGCTSFSYDSAGHYVASRGYETGLQASNLTQVQIADPHYTYGGYKWIPVTNLYNCTMAHWRHAIIW